MCVGVFAWICEGVFLFVFSYSETRAQNKIAACVIVLV